MNDPAETIAEFCHSVIETGKVQVVAYVDFEGDAIVESFPDEHWIDYLNWCCFAMKRDPGQTGSWSRLPIRVTPGTLGHDQQGLPVDCELLHAAAWWWPEGLAANPLASLLAGKPIIGPVVVAPADNGRFRGFNGRERSVLDQRLRIGDQDIIRAAEAELRGREYGFET